MKTAGMNLEMTRDAENLARTVADAVSGQIGYTVTNGSRPSTPRLREDAIRAVLAATASAAERHDHEAVANLSTALGQLEGVVR